MTTSQKWVKMTKWYVLWWDLVVLEHAKQDWCLPCLPENKPSQTVGSGAPFGAEINIRPGLISL